MKKIIATPIRETGREQIGINNAIKGARLIPAGKDSQNYDRDQIIYFSSAKGVKGTKETEKGTDKEKNRGEDKEKSSLRN